MNEYSNNVSDKNLFQEWNAIFNSYKALLRERHSEKYLNASNKFKAFLYKDGLKLGYNNFEKFFTKKFLIADISLYFRQFLLEENAMGRLTIESCSQILSRVNKILLFSENCELTRDKNILRAEIHYTSEGSHHGHDSYSDEEIELIKNVLKQELNYIEYVIQNPNYVTFNSETISCSKEFLETLKLFEDPECLSRIPIPATNKNQALSKKHRRFFALACKSSGGLIGFYRKIGVIDLVDAKVMGCLLLKLAMETGYNPCSLYSLKVDCLNEKTLPFGNPSIEFKKNRSDGHNTMPILLYDDDPLIMDLKQKQYQIVKKTINSILLITKRIREQAPKNLKHFLFIYQMRGPRKFSEISLYEDRVSHTFCKHLISVYKLIDNNGAPLKLRIVRFRSTRITQMVREGYDIFEVQAAAVHDSIASTLNYIRTRKIEPQLDAENLAVVERIYNSFMETKDSSNENGFSTNGQTVFKGVLSNCRNPYDPPDEIKRIQNYRQGKACTSFNMCLTCPNVIVTKHHLPILINYRKQILNSNVVQNNEGPHPHIYKRSLAILNSLLDEEKSLFPKAELDAAKAKAERLVDDVIDPLFNVPAIIEIR